MTGTDISVVVTLSSYILDLAPVLSIAYIYILYAVSLFKLSITMGLVLDDTYSLSFNE